MSLKRSPQRHQEKQTKKYLHHEDRKTGRQEDHEEQKGLAFLHFFVVFVVKNSVLALVLLGVLVAKLFCLPTIAKWYQAPRLE